MCLVRYVKTAIKINPDSRRVSEIWTGHFPNTNQKRCRLSQLAYCRTLLQYFRKICIANCTYCDVLLESRNIGARVYDRFLGNGLAKRLHNRIAPVSIQRKHLYNNRGMQLLDNGDWLEAFPLQRNSYTTCSRYGPWRDCKQRRHLVQRSVLRYPSTREVSSKTVL
jgi:hypothetical protein